MGDTIVIVICIILGAVLMFVFPMMQMAGNNDDIAQVAVQSATSEYVAKISSTGEITIEDYDKFVQTIYATGNTYDIEFEIQISDGNSDKKTTTVNPTKTGEQKRYSVFTNEVLAKLNEDGVYPLKKGDIVIVIVRNSNQTLFQTLQAVFYATTSDSYQIAAQQAAVVGTSGE